MCQLRSLLVLVLLLVACAAPTPIATPFPFPIEIANPEPTIDISNCSTSICCSDCPDIAIDRVIDGDTFQSANARIRSFGVDAPERGETCFNGAIASQLWKPLSVLHFRYSISQNAFFRNS